MAGLCADLAAHGLAAWNLEYRRVGNGGGWPETFLDVAAGSICSRARRPSISRASARSGTAREGISRCGQRLGTGSRPALPARSRASSRARSCRRPASPTSASRPSRAPRTSRRAHCSATPSDVYALASPRELLPLGVDQLVLHGERDDTVAIGSRIVCGSGRGGGRQLRARVLPGPATSSTSTPPRRRGGRRARLARRAAQLSAARREATKRSSAGAPSSAATSAAEPTTTPSASSAAAAACAGVEIPKPA